MHFWPWSKAIGIRQFTNYFTAKEEDEILLLQIDLDSQSSINILQEVGGLMEYIQNFS